jgi:hypothetical protein
VTDEQLIHCKRCGADKPGEAFYQPYPGAYRKPCKQCISEDRRKRYRESNGADVSYEQVLKRDYGITLAEYNEKLRKQASRCAICRRGEMVRTTAQAGTPRRLSVDHDHVTGAVRGLLCQRCNTLVWAIEDNHTTIDAIRKYIEQWQDTFANGAPL